MSRYEVYTAYTLDDFLRYKDDGRPNEPIAEYNDVATYINLSQTPIMERIQYLGEDTYGYLPVASDFINEIGNSAIYIALERVILGRYLSSIISYSEYDKLTEETSPKIYGKFVRNYLSILYRTWAKYENEITLFYNTMSIESINSEPTIKMKDLLQPIKSSVSNKSKLNEVPASNIDNIYDDNYANQSNTSETNSSTDGTTLINRIDEIVNNCYNIYDKWANEFACLFDID